MTDSEWQERVKGLLKAELKRRGISYKQLAEKLGGIGINESDRNIANKLARGGFSAVFLVQCLSVIGCETVHIESAPAVKVPSPPAPRGVGERKRIAHAVAGNARNIEVSRVRR